MAVISKFEVTVSCDGIPLPEYPVPARNRVPGIESVEPEANDQIKVTRYIVSDRSHPQTKL